MGREFHHITIGTSHGVHSLQLSPSPYGGIGIIVATCRRLRHDVPRRPDLTSSMDLCDGCGNQFREEREGPRPGEYATESGAFVCGSGGI